MTIIRTTCKTCGDVEIGTADLKLELSCDGGEGMYVFTCPRCSLAQSRSVTHKDISILLASGVKYEVVRGPVTEEEVESFVVDLNDEEKTWRDLLLGGS